jgi:VCBS repeat-containing protein
MAKPSNKNRRKHQRRRAERLVFEDLEPRVLLSADPLAVAIADSFDAGLTEQAGGEPASLVALMDVPEAPCLDAGLDPTAGVQAPGPLDLDGVASLMDEVDSAETSVELIFLDPRVEDYQQLIDGLADDSSRSFEVVVLDADRDGIEQISGVLASKEGIDAVHIISHGSQAGMQIGGAWLTAENLSSYATEISGWSDSLDADADLLLYGCDLAASADGLTLLEGLAGLSGADVAASDDLTGSASQGGDWDLERQVGDIETQIAMGLEAQQAWMGLLAEEPMGTAIWGENLSTSPEWTDWNGTAFDPALAVGADTGQYVTMAGAESPTRDEKIVVGMDANGTISAQVWDGTAWTPVSMTMQSGNLNSNGELASIKSPTDLSRFAVVYQQNSGNAMLVWDNGGGNWNFSYSIWDGSKWSQEAQLAPLANGNFVEIDLVANPNSDELLLVGSTDANQNNMDYVMYWDPTDPDPTNKWYEFPAGLESANDGFTDASVAYEQNSGQALVVYGNGTTGVYSKVWDGSTLTDTTSLVTVPPGITGTVEWTRLTSDPKSDQIALAVRTTAGEGWVAIWDGSSNTWQTSQIVSTTLGGSGDATSDANIDVAFEAESGDAMVVYGSGSDGQIYYRTWSAGTWSGESLGPNVGAVATSALTLEAAPYTNGIMLAVQDVDSDLNYVYWDGTAWAAPVEHEIDTGQTSGQPFLYLWDQGNRPPVIDSHGGAETVALSVSENTVDVTQVTATDWDGNTLTYSVSGGDDASFFTVDSASGVLTFSAAPDYENPLDLDGNNIYVVEVRVDDGQGGFDTQKFNVNVLDVANHIVVVDTTSDKVDADVAAPGFSIEALNTDPGSDGVISLREAILAANATVNDVSGLDEIWFDIAGADHTISLTTALPNITDAVIIDGFSEPAYMPGGQLIVEIDGSGAGAMQAGLVLSGGSSTIQGLVINNIAGDGILINATAAGSRIVGNFIGTDEYGDMVKGNTGAGIRVEDAAGVQIGGPQPEDRNIIAGNGSSGILLNGVGTVGTVIQGNYIGVDIDGQMALGNGKNGIDLIGGAHQNRIEGNIIGGSSGAGIRLSGGGVQDNVIIGNYIGTNVGYDNLVNGAQGVLIENGASNNTIGDAGGGNLIAYNDADGILVTGNTSVGNSLLGNEIFANAGAEIKLDGGGNSSQAAPVLTAAEYDGANLDIYGELTSSPNTSFLIEFFVVSATNADPSGAGGAEGYVYSDMVTTDNTGFVSFSFTVPTTSVAVGDYITAIATVDDAGDLTDSSAFSQNIAITVPNNPPTTSGIADVTVDEDAPDTVIDLFAGFDDAEDLDSALTYTVESISNPSLFDAAQIDGVAGTLTLQYAADVFGTSSITVRATDTGGKFIESAFMVTVNSVNDPPVADDELGLTTAEDTPLNIDVRVGDSDVDGDPLNVTEIDGTAIAVGGSVAVTNGSVTLLADGTLDFTPASNYVGPVNFAYTVSDGSLSDIGNVAIDVTPVNDAPVVSIIPTVTSLPEDTDTSTRIKVADVAIIDVDGGANTLSLTGTDAALFEIQGTELFLKAGTVLDFETKSALVVNVEVDDTSVGSSPDDVETLNITVTNIVLAPSASIPAGPYNVTEQTPLALHGTGISVAAPDAGGTDITVTLTVAEGEVNVDPGLTGVGVVGAGSNMVTLSGSASEINALLASDGSSGTIEYYNASDTPSASTTLTVTVADGINSAVNEATTIDIAAENDAPTAVNDGTYMVDEDGSLSVSAASGVLANDVDLEGDPLTAILVAGPSNAQSFTLNSDGSFEYTPAPDFNGTDSFTYKVNDGSVDGTTARADITVTAVNDPPSLALSTTSVGYTEDAATATLLDPGLTISDPDDTQLSGARVTITDFIAGDVLGFDTSGTSISASYDAATGVLTLNGTDSIINYERVLRTVAFSSTSDDPTLADTQTTRSVLWEITDADADGSGWQEIDSASSSIVVGAVNDAPMTTGIANVTVDEDAAPSVINLVSAFSDAEDPASALTYSVVGNTNPALFSGVAIDLASDELTLTYAADANGTAGLTVRATDSGGQFVDTSFTVTVNPIDDLPVAVDDAVSVDEDGIVGASVADNDTGLGDAPVVYALVGGSGPNEGLLTFNSDGSFVYAPDPDFSGSDGFSYTVTDVDGDSATATVTLTINPQNDLPNPADDSNVASEGGSAVGGNVLANDSSPDAPTTVTAADESGTAITIGTPYTTAAGGELTINSDGSYSYTPPSQGQVPVAGLIESFTYAVTDGSGDTATAALSITVDNSDLSLPQAVADSFTVDEGATFDTTTGDLLASGSASVLGNDTGLIDTPISVSLVSGVSHGTLSLNADGSFVYTHDGSENLADAFTYRITDDDGQTSDASVSISVTPVNDNAPLITSAATASVAEGDTAVLQVMVSDADLPGDTLSFGIAATGADGALFQIDGSGNLSFISAPDFEAPADANGDNVYEVGVEVFDGVHTAIQDISVTVTAVNDNAPIITSTATPSVAEGDTAVLQVTASDADLPGDTLSFAITGSGADDALFQIDGSGNLSFVSAPNYEAPADANGDNLYEVDVEVSDGVNTTTQSMTVDVTPVNDHVPVITSSIVVDVAENTSAVLTVTAEDDDLPGDSISFAIVGTGADDSLFRIDAVTGALSFIAAPDYETPADANGDNVYEVDVEVFDGVNTGTQSITVNVTPVNDSAPVITSPLNVSVPENTSAVAQVTATDDDVPGDTLSISIAGTGADDSLFQIDGSGNLSFIAAPDYENPADADANNNYAVDISVTDGVNTTVETLTVTVADGNELPVAADQVFSISEGASNGQFVGQVTASDPEGGTLSFAIVDGDPSGAFAINAANGRITVADATLLDHETRPQVALTVEVTDDGAPALSAYPLVTINVTDVNEAPVNIGLWDPVAGQFDNSVEENTDSSGGAVFRDLVTSDPDAGDTHSYAIVGGADAGKFTLSGNRLTLNDGLLDYERQSSYEVTVRSTDAAGLFIERTLTMVVNDLNDAPVITSTASASILENDAAATTLTAIDQDGDTLGYFISGGADQALFAVDPVTGEVSFLAAPDYENPLDADVNNLYEVQVSVGDGGASVSQLITVSVADGADAPSGVLLSNSTLMGQTDTAGGLTVGALTAIDQDVGDTAVFSIIGGTDAASFRMGGASGNDLILEDGVLDASVQSSYQVTVRVTDSTGLNFDQTLVVTVEPYVPPVVDEPDPVDEPAPPPADEPEPDPEPTTTDTGSGETAAETATETLNEETTVDGGGMHSPAEESGSTSDTPSAAAVDLGGTDAGAGTGDTQVALADIPNFTTTALDSGAALQGSASGFVGGTIPAPDGAPGTEGTVAVDPVIRQLVEPGEFVQELDEVRGSVTDQKIVIEKTVVGSTVVASTGLSVGYVLWLVRGGVLISSLLSSLPAWRLIDPLPVLAYASDDDEDEESLESMVKSNAGDADKDPEELPEQDPPLRPAPQPSGTA